MGPGEGAAVPTYPELGHQDVRDAAQHRHEVEDVPGVAEIILGEGEGMWGPGPRGTPTLAPPKSQGGPVVDPCIQDAR